MTTDKINSLINLLKEGRRVFIQTHNFPDPDAISSAFGLQQFLLKYDIDATICYVGSIDRFNTRKMMDTFGIEIYSYDDINDKIPRYYLRTGKANRRLDSRLPQELQGLYVGIRKRV